MTTATLLAGRYRVERELARGGMAAVVAARDELLDRPVAVKLLDAVLVGDDDVRQRFLREGRLAARLAHPNVVAVYDTGELDGRPYIVMELVGGPSLAGTLAEDGPLPPRRVAELALQACSGLEHAHRAGVVHRDVKPGNLLLAPDGTLKIVDFGIARATDGHGLTEAGTVLGTAAYLAPEVARGEPATPASDLWSLGATLHECLTGRPPRTVTTLADLTRPLVLEPVAEIVPGVAAGLAEAVTRCLEEDPSRRPRSAAEVAELVRGTSSEPAPTPRPGRTDPVRHLQPLSRRRLLGAAGALAVAGALLVAGLAALGGGDDPATLRPAPAGGDPEQRARELADWLRANAREE